MRSLIVTALLALSSLTPGTRAVLAAPQAPRLVLWAWERPEDLRFLAPHHVGVAYLAATLTLRGGAVSLTPRRQPLRVPPNSYMITVIRLEASRSQPPTLDKAQQLRVVDEINSIVRSGDSREVQIDFDAAVSQREEYRQLLSQLRATLPADRKLTMTALASWCVFDRWLDSAPMPVDEVVPMVFAMGRGGFELSNRLTIDGDFRSKRCRAAIGISTDEAAVTLPRGRRTYVFNPRPWSPGAFNSMKARLSS